jgi:ParB family chromosome partitioning protein
LSSDDVVRVYEEDAGRKRDLIRRADVARDMLVLIIEAVRRLSVDEAFLTLLMTEGLDSMPERIAARAIAVTP